MNGMRCDECKFWNRSDGRPRHYDEDERALRPSVGLCEKAQPYWETTEWKNLDEDDDSNDPDKRGPVRTTRPEFVGLKMFVQDGSDYKATLLTTPDFYCAHFERR